MGLAVAFLFARDRVRMLVSGALAVASAVLLLGFCAPAAWTDTTTLINFDNARMVPGTTSPQAGVVLGNQYESQGVVFNE
jgi:hypothetical protein